MRAPAPRGPTTTGAIALLAVALASLAADQPTAPARDTATGRPWHFAFDVLPWLTRQGCAAAECHGGGLGRGGLKLSLFGGEPRADWEALVVDRDGRRIDPVAPEHSLAVAKPSRALPHRGGRRLPAGSAAWRAVRDWIAAGARWSAGPEPVVEQLRLTHDADGADPDRLRVAATFRWDAATTTRRATEDVSDRAIFASSDPGVATVDGDGRVTFVAAGAATLTARFAGRDAALRLVRPFDEVVTPPAADDPPLDRAWRAGLDELGLAAGPRADDATLLRRLTLALTGRIPTPAEAGRFHADPAADRVALAADRLLASDDFVATAAGWLAAWAELEPPHAVPERLRGRDAALRARLAALVADDGPLAPALAAAVAVDDPLLARFADARDRAEFVGRSLLGVRLGCARCHDHPQDRWTRADHLGFAALFADPRPGPQGGMVAGVLFDDRDGAAVRPRPAPVLPQVEAGDGDLAAARTALATDARTLRTLANRVFAAVVGRGLVEPLDDHRPTNPPRHPALLDALVDRLRAGGGRLRPLVRAIVVSDLFARSSGAADDDPHAAARRGAFALAEARAMPARTFRASVEVALGVPFDDPEPPSGSPLATALHRRHGAALTGALADPTNAVRAIADFVPGADARIDALFELILSRAPRPAERAALRPRLTAASDPAAWLCAAARAMLLSREFTSIR